METPPATTVARLRVAVLGASGRIGRLIVRRGLERGYELVCQTRDAEKLAEVAARVRIHALDPRDGDKLGDFVRGADVVVFALGIEHSGATTLFSEVTEALIAAMSRARIKRLVAITGVGAGETRGHGGFAYDWIIYPLFTRHRYRDKDRQEARIAASDLEWIIVRPAPFRDRPVRGDLQVCTDISPGTVLRRIAPEEVAAFVVDQLESDRFLYQRPFIGHP